VADSSATGATYNSPNDATDKRAFVKLWLDTLDLADSEEKDWRKEAEEAGKIFAGKKGARNKAFNIFHSNIETLCPALYNSTPSADVRRRYSDNDPVGKVVADILERAIEFSVDSHDFDAVMKQMIRDAEITGRGVPRIRYEPLFGQPLLDGNGQPMNGEDGQPLRELISQGVTTEYVPWRFFRRGPGRTWSDVPWVAFGDFLTIDALRQINPDIADDVPMNYTAGSETKKNTPNEKSIFKRCLAWQIWDRDNRRVVTVCPDYHDDVISMVEDPLGLTEFFPTPRPYQPILVTDTLTPVVPYSIYEDLVDELNEITKRISRLIRQLRPRALYAGQEINDIQALSSADDGEMIPATNLDAFVGGGGIDKLIAWWPLDPVVNALAHLVQQREQVKQTIYEVTGIADVLRGATNANETLGAQQIKAQWGSLRIQNRQAEVQRVARDLFRMKAEILAGKFTWDMLSQMTGIKLLPQAQKDMLNQQKAQAAQAAQAPPPPGQPPAPPPAPIPPDVEKLLSQPSMEECQAILQSDIARAYRIDVESDSTIRGDLTRNQQDMSTFLQGTAQFFQAMGPLVQQQPAAMKPVVEIYAAFARQFKLGKQAEDALDGMSDSIGAADAQKAPPPPDPKVELEKQKIENEKGHNEAKLQLERDKMAGEQISAKYKADIEAKTEVDKHNISANTELAKHAAEMRAKETPPVSVQFDGNQALEGMSQQIAGVVQSNSEAMAGAVQSLAQSAQALTMTSQSLAQASAQVAQAAHVMAAPKRIVRDNTGRAIGAEPIIDTIQ
jgi:hypothetical protein